MPASYLEIVQLSKGEYALQRSDGDGDSLVRITFSQEAQEALQQHSATVVRAMISAAIQTVSALNSSGANLDDDLEAAMGRENGTGPTIH